MISKQQIKFIQSLRLKKFRKQYGTFIAEGAKIVQELLLSNENIINIYGVKEWYRRRWTVDGGHETNLNNIVKEKFQEVSEKELGLISELSTPNEVLALVRIPEPVEIISFQNITLALESIRDPGNLGTIIRIADWYGLNKIICSGDCVDAYSSKVVQASMGSIFRVKVIYKNLTEFLSETNIPKYAAALENSITLHEFKDFKKGIVVIGNESKGISPNLLELCDYKLHIPRFGKAESLNAAVAAGIFLDNFRRQMN